MTITVKEGDMMAAGRYLMSVIVVMSLAATALDAAADSPLQGVYSAQGVDADGAPYAALVQIIKFGDSYLVSWMFADESAEASEDEFGAIGVGIARDGMLAVSYFGEDFAGVVVYGIEKGGRRLVGQWTGAGGDGVLRQETLTRLEGPQRLSTTESTQPRPRRDRATLSPQ